jgi:dihydropyrimidinase
VLDLLVKNGKIITESQVFDADIGIEDGKISEISRAISSGAGKTIDAQGKLVLPGLIDGHTHMEMPFMGTVTNDDFYSGTVAAACGGVTTIVDFSVQAKGDSLRNTYETWRKKADPKVCIDYSLHMIVRDYNASIRNEIKDIIKEGITSFKLFMAYKNSLYLDDGSIFSIMEEVKNYGGLIGLHCENGDVIDCLVSKFLSEGKVEPEYHAKSRPNLAEAEAVNRGIRLAQISGSPMYVVHTSTRFGVEEVRTGAESGFPVYCETCPHYLVFTDEAYRRPDGNRYIMSPPLRSGDDRTSLWQGLANGSVKTVGSDHACFSSAMKAQKDFSKVPNGVPGTEVILPILYSAGVTRGLLPINRLVQCTSFNPAKLFGLYPRKGTLAIGSDADIVILDPKKKMRLSVDNLHSNIDYSIYEDVTVTGYPVVTISHGRIVAQDGQIMAKAGQGQFVKGEPFPTGKPDIY